MLSNGQEWCINLMQLMQKNMKFNKLTSKILKSVENKIIDMH